MPQDPREAIMWKIIGGIREPPATCQLGDHVGHKQLKPKPSCMTCAQYAIRRYDILHVTAPSSKDYQIVRRTHIFMGKSQCAKFA